MESHYTNPKFLQPAVTQRVVLPETLPEVATILEVPSATAVPKPPLLLTVAAEVLDELQVTSAVTS